MIGLASRWSDRWGVQVFLAASSAAVVASLLLARLRSGQRRSIGLPRALAGRRGFCPERLACISRWMDSYVLAGKLPCAAVTVARDGQVVFAERRGFQDVDGAVALTDDTIFEIFSMTKPVTAVATMILVERLQLRLEDPVSRFFPEFAECTVCVPAEGGGVAFEPQKSQLTVKDLLTHCSGLTYGSTFGEGIGDDPVLEAVVEKWNAVGADCIAGFGCRAAGLEPCATLGDWARRVASVPLFFQPGTKWFYSYGLDLLGAVIEAASGVPLEDFFQREIFEPLHMHDTSFTVPAGRRDRLAAMYNFVKRSDSAGQRAFERSGSPLRGVASPQAMPKGGGGLFGTQRDYVRFAQMLANGGELEGRRILSPRTVEYMFTNHLPGGRSVADLDAGCGYSEADVKGLGFGLGVSVMLSPADFQVVCSAGEVGWGGYSSCWFAVDRKERLVAVFMTQLVPSTSYPIRKELRNLIYSALIH